MVVRGGAVQGSMEVQGGMVAQGRMEAGGSMEVCLTTTTGHGRHSKSELNMHIQKLVYVIRSGPCIAMYCLCVLRD